MGRLHPGRSRSRNPRLRQLQGLRELRQIRGSCGTHHRSACQASGIHWQLSILVNAVMTSRRHAFGDFWRILHHNCSIKTPIFFSSSPLFTLSSFTCHKSLLLLCFALSSESCFYLFAIWERLRWSALQASSVKGGDSLIYDIVFFLCRLLIQSCVKNALYKIVS